MSLEDLQPKLGDLFAGAFGSSRAKSPFQWDQALGPTHEPYFTKLNPPSADHTNLRFEGFFPLFGLFFTVDLRVYWAYRRGPAAIDAFEVATGDLGRPASEQQERRGTGPSCSRLPKRLGRVGA